MRIHARVPTNQLLTTQKKVVTSVARTIINITFCNHNTREQEAEINIINYLKSNALLREQEL